MNELEKSLVIANCYGQLESAGITAYEFTDYGKLSEVIERSNKDYLVPVLSDMSNDFYHSNVLWLVAEKDGVPVMLGGARLEDLDHERLTNYWPRLFRRHYGQGSKEIVGSVNEKLSDVMRGRLVYFGDLFSEPRASGANRINLRAFTMIGHLLTNMRWNQDYTYAFIRKKDILRGAAASYGFNNFAPRPFDWIETPFPRSKTEYCAYSSRECVYQNAKIISEELSANQDDHINGTA